MLIVLYLLLTDPPMTTEIQSAESEFIEDTTVDFTCLSSGAFPQPKFVWTKGGQSISGTDGRRVATEEDQ